MRCTHDCAGDPACRRLDCCHTCVLYIRDACVDDGSLGFRPRYFVRMMYD